MSSFWQFFDTQMAIFRRVSTRHATAVSLCHLPTVIWLGLVMCLTSRHVTVLEQVLREQIFIINQILPKTIHLVIMSLSYGWVHVRSFLWSLSIRVSGVWGYAATVSYRLEWLEIFSEIDPVLKGQFCLVPLMVIIDRIDCIMKNGELMIIC